VFVGGSCNRIKNDEFKKDSIFIFLTWDRFKILNILWIEKESRIAASNPYKRLKFIKKKIKLQNKK
jgi:hypothetical protein